MERAFRFVFCAILTIVSCATTRAQNYIIDDIYGDSVMVNEIILSADKSSEVPGETAFYLQPGDTVTVTRILKGNSYPAITITGKDKEYTVSQGNLVFCDNNPAGTVDHWADMGWNKNRVIRKFFASFTPYAMIAILFVIAMAFTFMGLKIGSLRKYALYAVPGCLLVASILEIWAYIVMGNDAFWWCDKDRYGFFGSFFRAIPYVAFVGFQIFSIKFYQWLLLGKDSEKTLSIKPMAISLAICIPTTLVAVIALTLCDIRGLVVDILTIVVFLASLAVGVLISMKKNIQMLGKTAGLAFSIFGIVYIIGSLIAVWGLLVVLLRLIIQILIICAAIVGVGFVMSKGGSESSGSGAAPSTQQYWIDAEGGRHVSQFDAESANKRIAERKANS